MRKSIAILIAMSVLPVCGAAAAYPIPVQGDFRVKDFRFASGETLPELRIHYRTIGEPHRDSRGHVDNAILILHGTGGAGDQFLNERFANVLFGPGQLLDGKRYFIVLPDGIGHGKSSKPSDGAHMRFPHYTYDDMVRAQHELLTAGLGIDHLRLVMGTSMGGMHTWVWGEMYPGMMDALAPFASLPVEIAGRNRMFRCMVMDSIRNDPEWKEGEYKSQPKYGLTGAAYTLLVMSSSPLQMQKEAPTREASERLYHQIVDRLAGRMDANDTIYQFDASRQYNPAPQLSRIQAPLLAINSADDQINPPELGVLEAKIKEVKRGRYVLLPITPETRGHGTHTLAKVWKDHLAALLKATEPKP
jgi:homoserine O-acetyltransferase